MTILKCHSKVLLLLGLVWIQACRQDASQELNSPSTLTAAEKLVTLERTIPALLDSGAVTGLSMAIVDDSTIVWARGFGTRNAESGEPVDANTVFEAASLSKPVFAYAVLRLAESGVIDVDAPLTQYYEYESIQHDGRSGEITARMVLTHATGFPNWRPRGGQLTINFEPGSRFSYSGEGFVYLQLAVMRLTGEPMQQLVERLVFSPLGMTRSSYTWNDGYEENLALPHGANGELLPKARPERGNAAASLHTTATDFARFLIAVMNGVGLNDSTAQAMLSPQIEVDSGVAWGLGIGIQDNEAGRAFWHWGDNTGYKAYTLTYPEQGVGIVWFTNSENGQTILKALLAGTVGGTHPAADWLEYEQYDAPTRLVRGKLERVIDPLP